jgi:predicted glycosyltransferase
MRFSANDASHDARVRSVPDEVIARIVSSSSEHHDVVVSREGHGTRLFPSRSSQPEPPVEGPDHRVREVDPSDFLHLLSSAEVFVGDSGSVTMEAAALGVPTLRLADTRREIIDRLQDLYGLVEHFDLDDTVLFESRLAAMHGSGSSRSSVAEGHHRLIKDSEDVTLWFADLCERFGDTHMRSGAHER